MILAFSLLSFSLAYGTIYEGTNDDLGISIEPRSTASSELLDNPDGTQYIEPNGLVIETMSDEDPFGENYTTPIKRALSVVDEGSSVWPSYDWSADVEIYPGKVGSGQDFDEDEDTHDLYAILDTDHSSYDSVIVYRSQDHGVTWSFWRATYNSGGEMNNPKVRVAKDAGGQTWVCMMYATGTSLRVRRMTPSQASSHYETITSNAVNFADMDAEIGTGAYVYATWEPSGTHDVHAARNALDGSGWVNTGSIFGSAQTSTQPAVAAGAGGTVAVAFIDARLTSNPQVRIKRSTNHGSTWLGSAAVSNSTASGLENCDIAFSHGSTQVGWITVTFKYSNDNFGYYYSTDSGASWTYGTIFSGSGTDENLGSIRTRKATGSLTLAYNVDPGDSTMFSWATTSSPTAFSTPERINDYNATGHWPAATGWNNSYSAILYTNWNGNYRLMFDWWGNTGIGDTETSSVLGTTFITSAPNPFYATTNINFNLSQSSPVTISVYNVAGQLVNTLADNQNFNEGSNSVQWNGRNEAGTMVSPGVYFCRLSADGISQTHRMLMVR